MQPNVRLTLSNSEWSVAVVHEAVLGFAQVCGLDPLELDDLDTAVAEAAKNVTWHAYDGVAGPLEVELRALDGAVHATVRDEGIGIRPHVGEQRPHHVGIGMPLVHARSRRVIYTNRADGGTEVMMELDMPSLRSLEPAPDADGQPAPPEGDWVSLWLSPPAVSGPVLAHLARPLARSAGFTQAMFEALQGFLAALAAAEQPTGQLRLTLGAAPEAVELRFDVEAPAALAQLDDPTGVLALERLSERALALRARA